MQTTRPRIHGRFAMAQVAILKKYSIKSAKRFRLNCFILS